MVISSKRDDVLNKYICLVNGHNGKIALKVFWTIIRVVCQNTLKAALQGFCNGADGVSVKHTRFMANRVDEVRAILGLTEQYYGLVKDVFATFNQTPIVKADVTRFLDEVFPINTAAKSTTRTTNRRMGSVQCSDRVQ
jgi:hypothetical protein